MRFRVEHMREQPLHIHVIYAAAAVNVACPQIYGIPGWIIHMHHQQPHVHDVHDTVSINVTAEPMNVNQRQIILVRTACDVVRRVTEPVTIAIAACINLPIVSP